MSRKVAVQKQLLKEQQHLSLYLTVRMNQKPSSLMVSTQKHLNYTPEGGNKVSKTLIFIFFHNSIQRCRKGHNI